MTTLNLVPSNAKNSGKGFKIKGANSQRLFIIFEKELKNDIFVVSNLNFEDLMSS